MDRDASHTSPPAGAGEEAQSAHPLGDVQPGRRARIAIAVLIFCCIAWGLSFPVMQIVTTAMNRAVGASGSDPETTTRVKLAIAATFNGWRFGLAAVIYWLLTRRRQSTAHRADTLAGLVVGAFFGAGMFLQLVGLQYTLPSVSGFLTALPIFTPLGQAFLLRRTIGGRVWMALGVAVVGVVVFCLANPGAVTANTLSHKPPIAYLGEALTILGAMMFAGQILAVGHFGLKADVARLTCVAFATAAVLNGVAGAIMGAGEIYTPAVLSTLARDGAFVTSTGVLVLLSSVIALHLMNRFQPRISPAMASVVYCTEPVFATLFSVFFLMEKLTPLTILGGMIILVAVLVVATARSESSPGGAQTG